MEARFRIAIFNLICPSIKREYLYLKFAATDDKIENRNLGTIQNNGKDLPVEDIIIGIRLRTKSHTSRRITLLTD
jgi:hypothetical protein